MPPETLTHRHANTAHGLLDPVYGPVLCRSMQLTTFLKQFPGPRNYSFPILQYILGCLLSGMNGELYGRFTPGESIVFKGSHSTLPIPGYGMPKLCAESVYSGTLTCRYQVGIDRDVEGLLTTCEKRSVNFFVLEKDLLGGNVCQSTYRRDRDGRLQRVLSPCSKTNMPIFIWEGHALFRATVIDSRAPTAFMSRI